MNGEWNEEAELVKAYITNQAEIKLIEAENSTIKTQLEDLLPPDQGKEWVIADVPVVWVTGRKSEKLDKGKLKLDLIQNRGIDSEVVKQAFDAATTQTVGNPYLRIGGAIKGSGE